MKTYDHLKIVTYNTPSPATKAVGVAAARQQLTTMADWHQQQLAKRDAWQADAFKARLQQILTPGELQQVYAAGLGTKSTLDLPASIVHKINTDPTIKAIRARAAKR